MKIKTYFSERRSKPPGKCRVAKLRRARAPAFTFKAPTSKQKSGSVVAFSIRHVCTFAFLKFFIGPIF
jgi:hypothetical protein